MSFAFKTILCLFAGIGLASLLYAHQGNWTLSYEAQVGGECLPYRLYFVNRKVNHVQYGDVVVVDADNIQFKYLPKGREVAKMVVGLPGDIYEVENNQLFINGKYWGDLNLLLAIDDIEVEQGVSKVIREGQILALGTQALSVDGRYFGLIRSDWVKGKAHAIF